MLSYDDDIDNNDDGVHDDGGDDSDDGLGDEMVRVGGWRFGGRTREGEVKGILCFFLFFLSL